MSQPLTLEVLLVVEELANGDWLAWPFADREKVAYARERDDVLEEQELFLRDHLAMLPAGELARFDPTGEARLHRVEVPLQLAGLPERMSIPEPLSFPCLVVPDAKHAWVVVLPLDHALWVEDPE